MNKELQELNRIRKRNALAEKLLIAEVNKNGIGKVSSYDPLLDYNSTKEAIENCFYVADSFIEYSEK